MVSQRPHAPKQRVARPMVMGMIFSGLAVVVTALNASDDSPSPARPSALTVMLHGAHCKECVEQLRSHLKKVKGVTFQAADVRPPAEPRKLRPKYFSPPFELTIANEKDTNVGALAAAFKKPASPHAEDFPPGVNLVLWPSRTIDESLIMELRAALRPVNGVEADVTGGLGGQPRAGYVWIRLEEAGGAGLDDILKAARSVDSDIKTRKTDNE